MLIELSSIMALESFIEPWFIIAISYILAMLLIVGVILAGLFILGVIYGAIVGIVRGVKKIIRKLKTIHVKG
jgi:hypothetical protein